MKNNKKRGFTLVELLVVIAILAILATVAVVGYSSFMTRARVSNDEEVANQLNDYWTALKADSMDDYYGKDITQDNVWYITQTILNKTGLGSYVPQSLRDGYHLYFKFDPDGKGGEYVVAKEDEIQKSAMNSILAWLTGHAAEVNGEPYMPGIFFDASDNMYFLVCFDGSDLSKAVNEFYTLDSLDDIIALKTFIANSTEISNYCKRQLDDALNATVFATSEGTYTYAPNESARQIFMVAEGTESISKTIYKINSDGSTTHSATVDADTYFITVNREMTITLPNSVVSFPQYSLNVNPNGQTVTIIVSADSIDPDKKSDPITAEGVIVEMGGVRGTVDSNGNILDSNGNPVVGDDIIVPGNPGKDDCEHVDADGDYVCDIEDCKADLERPPVVDTETDFKVEDFEIICNEDASSAKLLLDGNYLYIACDYDGIFTLKGDEATFKGNFNSTELIWTLENDNGGMIEKSGDGYKIKNIPTVGDTGNYTATITAQAVSGGHKEILYVYVVRPVSAEFTVETVQGTFTTANSKSIELLYDGTDPERTYNLTVTPDSITYNEEGKVELTPTVVFEGNNDLFSISDNVLTLKEVSYKDASGTFTVTLSHCEATTFTVTVNDTSAAEFETKAPFKSDTMLYRVGNKNTVTLGTFFKIKDDSTGTNVPELSLEKGAGVGHGATWSSDALTAEGWATAPITFTGRGVVTLKLGEATVTVEVVNGYNVTNYDEIVAAKPVNGNNVVFLNNIDISSGGKITFENSTLYGNGFVFNVEDGNYSGNDYISENYVIKLVDGTLNNVQILGKPFTNAAVTANNPDSICTVYSTGNDVIANCLITNTSAPVRVLGSDNTKSITIVNTTLKGGSIANLDVRYGQIIIENVTTINQPGDVDGSFGFGILGWYEGLSKFDITIKGTLTQYNYVSKTQVSSINVSGAGALASAIYSGPAKDNYVFTYNGEEWINMGILIMDTENVSPDDIYDNRTSENYAGLDVSYYGRDGYIYAESKASVTARPGDYTGLGQYHTIPSTPNFTIGSNVQDRVEGNNDYCTLIDNKVTISFDEGESKEFDLTDLFSVTKFEENVLNITGVSLLKSGNDQSVPYTTTSKILFTEQGTYKLTYMYIDPYNYNLNGDYSVTYTYEIEIEVIAVKPDAKNATFTFGSSNIPSTSVTIGGITYIMPDVEGTSATISSKIISGQTIYMPIVEAYTSDGEYKHSSTQFWAMCFPVLKNVITITDYANQGTGSAVTYDGDDTSLPAGLSVDSPETTFKYQSDKNAPTDPSTVNGVLVYKSPTLSNNGRNEMSVIAKYTYQDNKGDTFVYYVEYHVPETIEGAGGCFTSDTLITLADGTQKRVDELTFGDKILAWDFFTASYVEADISLLVNHGLSEYDVIYTKYSDGSVFKMIAEHGIFDYDLNKFVYITVDNVEEFVGHRFVKYNIDGSYDVVTMTESYVVSEYIESWSITSASTSNAFASGLLTVAPPEDFYNWIPMDGKLHYDAEQFAKDVETYGLYTYEDFKDYVTYEQFVDWNGAYLKIPVEKGYFTFEYILELIAYTNGWMPQN